MSKTPLPSKGGSYVKDAKGGLKQVASTKPKPLTEEPSNAPSNDGSNTSSKED